MYSTTMKKKCCRRAAENADNGVRGRADAVHDEPQGNQRVLHPHSDHDESHYSDQKGNEDIGRCPPLLGDVQHGAEECKEAAGNEYSARPVQALT